MSIPVISDSPTRPLKQVNPFAMNATSETFSTELLFKTITNSITIADEINTTQFSLWPEEEEAIENIRTGKTKIIKQTGEEFLKELDELINGS